MPSSATTVDPSIDATEEPLLPSYEAAMDFLDSMKLPSYRRSLSTRFHPYKRPSLKFFDERDRLFNTIFDDECILLDIPTTFRRVPGPRQMTDDAEATQRLISDIELAIQSELRVQRLDSTIVDFVEGVRRAHMPH